MYVCAEACAAVCLYACSYACIYACVHVCVCVCMSACAYVELVEAVGAVAIVRAVGIVELLSICVHVRWAPHRLESVCAYVCSYVYMRVGACRRT